MNVFKGIIPAINNIDENKVKSIIDEYRKLNPTDKRIDDELRPYAINEIMYKNMELSERSIKTKELVDWIYDLHLQNNTEHDTFEEAFKAGIECAIEELIELKKLRVGDVSFECTHEKTEFKHIRCNVCTDCGELVEIDV